MIAACSGASNGSAGSGTGTGTGTGGEGNSLDPQQGAVAPGEDAAVVAPGTDATAAAPDAGPGPLTLPTGPRFPVVPMRLTPQPGASGADAHVDLELRGDGTIYSHGQLVGQIAGDRVLGTDGREMLSVAPDGTVALQGRATAIRLTDAGEIMNPRGGVMRVGDDGTPLTVMPGAAPTRGALVFSGFRADARRTAALLALLVATTPLP